MKTRTLSGFPSWMSPVRSRSPAPSAFATQSNGCVMENSESGILYAPVRVGSIRTPDVHGVRSDAAPYRKANHGKRQRCHHLFDRMAHTGESGERRRGGLRERESPSL